jgi:chitin disaccharide deacetylase
MKTLPCATLLICADDFAMNESVDEGVLTLGEMGRIHAASCMTTPARWSRAAPQLLARAPRLLRGLHFNLTHGEPASAELKRHWSCFPSLAELMVAAHLERLPLAAVQAEWRTQYERFVQALGHAPEFLDGHQHVHHLRGVRRIVLAEALKRKTPVRNTSRVLGPGFALKRWLIQATGGRTLGRVLDRNALSLNDELAGVYDFRASGYAHHVAAWLRGLASARGRVLMVCHPAWPPAWPLASSASWHPSSDPIAQARLHEARFLASPAFADALGDSGLGLAV